MNHNVIKNKYKKIKLTNKNYLLDKLVNNDINSKLFNLIKTKKIFKTY